MANNFWFSCDNDTGEVVAKTEIKDDGTVRRYEYTEADNIKGGHGDKKYDDLKSFMNDKPSWGREKDAPKSINRRWYGNGHKFNFSKLIDEILESESLGYTKTLRRY